MERSVDHKHSDHYERGRTVEVLLRSSERASLSLANSHSFFWHEEQALEQTNVRRSSFTRLRTDTNGIRGASSMDLLLLSCRVRVRVDLYQDLALLAL